MRTQIASLSLLALLMSSCASGYIASHRERDASDQVEGPRNPAQAESQYFAVTKPAEIIKELHSIQNTRGSNCKKQLANNSEINTGLLVGFHITRIDVHPYDISYSDHGVDMRAQGKDLKVTLEHADSRETLVVTFKGCISD